jgi:3-oxoacyl-[acyl-carrier protein] reductase
MSDNQSETARDLEGRAAIVTGSAKNMGRTIAIALGRAGASVLINGRTSIDAAKNVAQEVVGAGVRAVVHMADVTDEGQVAGMIARAVDEFGRLDILVNNVSNRIAKPVAEITLEEWRGVIASALDGAFLCTRAALPHLEASDRAAIVNIGGVSGHAGVANRTAVAAAKAGLVGLTGSLAAEFADRDITVNCVAPGHFEHAGEPGRMSDHFRERPIPLGRVGEPEDIAAMVGLLCGPRGRYITGQTMHINGGWHIAT